MYKHVRLWKKLICWICFKGFDFVPEITLHYLFHSWADVTLLGFEPAVLRGVLTNKKYPINGKPAHIEKAALGKVIREDETQKIAREIGTLVMQGNYFGNVQDVRTQNYERTDELAPEFFYDIALLRSVNPAIPVDEHLIAMTKIASLQHRIAKPFWQERPTLLRHLVDYDKTKILVSTWKGHVTVLYPSKILDYLTGGLSMLLGSIGNLRVAVSSQFQKLKYCMPLIVQNSKVGIEVVLAHQVTEDKAFLDSMAHNLLGLKKPNFERHWKSQARACQKVCLALL